ncbi:MAG TPA: translation elongation factor 4 [Fibrobacteria bacterium]|nr:translation elongation factor 4 [Fibrobacteria bacterium]
MRPDPSRIRNFCIIAHIDHGKSTLADRMLEMTNTINKQKMQDQVLDDMDLERERGITIKSHAIRMQYEKDGQRYYLNLIDTPGHVDFTYEVSRSLAACEGAILVVDATQGIEAQTLSNMYLALENDLTLVPILNKIDLPSAHPDDIAESVGELLGYEPDRILRVSAKEGIGIQDLIERVIEEIPPPKADRAKPARALIFDSKFDSYRGAIAYIRMFDGVLEAKAPIRLMATGKDFEAVELGILTLDKEPQESLAAGEVGYLIGNIKNVGDTKIGDTIIDRKNPATEALKGYKDIKPMVFAGIYPVDAEDFEDLRDALEKLALNDSALSWAPETSTALGFGYRVGFLGLLHMEVVRERLDREFNMSVISTVPNVEYHVTGNDGEMFVVENPSKLPDAGKYEEIQEPYVKSQIIVPKEYVGGIMKLGEEKRGVYLAMEYLTPDKVDLKYEFPMGEIMFDFFDKLKSVSKGYASFDYELIGYRPGNLVKLDILLNGDPVDAFSVIIHRDKAYSWGNALCNKLKDLIPQQLFEVAIQAAIGGRIIARSTVKALRKNVTAKCYGGDISRKRKLLEKQKEGKKRMKAVGSVEIPQEAFLAVLSMDKD